MVDGCCSSYDGPWKDFLLLHVRNLPLRTPSKREGVELAFADT